MKKNYNIGIFDSGVGGTTVLKKVIELLPKEDIIYFGDNKNAPYGEKKHEQIVEHCIKVADFLNENECKIILIACNTATAASVDKLNERFNIPVIGVIEAGAKEAIKICEKGNIAVMATPYTCATEAYSRQIEKISSEIEVTNIPCKELCPMIEAGWEEHSNREEILKEYINQIPEDSNTIILGCTHYPIIKEDIEKHVGNRNIVDPATESALELKRVLKKNGLLNEKMENGKIQFYVSGETEKFKKTAESFLGVEIKKIERAVL